MILDKTKRKDMMMSLYLSRKNISLILGVTLGLCSFMVSAYSVENKQNQNIVVDSSIALSNDEIIEIGQLYHGLEELRNEYEVRAPLWLNSENENKVEFKKNKIFISLGMNCGPAINFENNKLTEAFFPFDWAISEFSSIYKALKSDFKDFLKLENLVLTPRALPLVNHKVYDKNYRIDYIHDFKNDGAPLYDYQQVRDKYYRRIDRFYRALKLGKHVYFFRTKIKKSDAIKLNNLIQKKFPKLKYTLVVMNDTSEFKRAWNVKNVKHFFIKDVHQAIAQHTRGKNGWDNVFKSLKIA